MSVRRQNRLVIITGTNSSSSAGPRPNASLGRRSWESGFSVGDGMIAGAAIALAAGVADVAPELTLAQVRQ
jgi:hypothetical protein